MNYFYNTFEFVPKPGDTIDDNVVIEEIGEGGRSRVYKVKNMSLEVERVVKLLKKPSEIDEERFVTEARISANLNHPNIVHCYRFAKYNDELPYIEMEFVDGHDLHYLIRKNIRLPYKIILSVLHYVCQALNVLHSCEYTLYDVKRSGVVHRDIKPGNILISRKGEVKLADFGIAKPKDLTIHTTEMQVVGTVYYLSPEQIRREELDFSTDIYSLGCVMYEMVTGKKAFRHKNLMDVMEAKKSSNYDKELLADIPKAFQEIINKCMSPDRLSRFLDIKELQQEIDKLLKKEGIYNPKSLISDFVQDPETFTAIQKVKVRRAKNLSVLRPVIFLGIGTIFLLLSVTFYSVFKESAESITKSVLPLKTKKITEIKKTDEPKNDADQKIVDNVVKTPIPEVKKIAKAVEKNNRVTKTVVSSKVNYEANPKTVMDAFLAGNYSQCLKLLESETNLNDTLLMCKMGALVEVGRIIGVTESISTISLNDGYLSYLKGRLAHKNGSFEVAVNEYMRSLTKPSFYKKVPFKSNYYLAICREEIYNAHPNSNNKKKMIKAFNLFLNNFCRSGNSKECRSITDLKNKHL